MSEDSSARLQFPFLRAGQAQKELLHNEALTLIDFLAQPTVLAFAVDTPPNDPQPGEAWIVGTWAGLWAAGGSSIQSRVCRHG
jgi:hypothetical protein